MPGLIAIMPGNSIVAPQCFIEVRLQSLGCRSLNETPSFALPSLRSKQGYLVHNEMHSITCSKIHAHVVAIVPWPVFLPLPLQFSTAIYTYLVVG